MSELQLDIDGPAAPPRANGEMVFEHPWQRRLFATTMALCESEAIQFQQFRDRLIAEISEHPDEYWSSWQDALEALLQQQQMCDLDQLGQRAQQFGQHVPRS